MAPCQRPDATDMVVMFMGDQDGIKFIAAQTKMRQTPLRLLA
jgi:hypothetical protein